MNHPLRLALISLGAGWGGAVSWIKTLEDGEPGGNITGALQYQTKLNSSESP